MRGGAALVPGARARTPRRPLITLLTDFGLDDVYVGVMKGVLAALAPEAPVIDITHGIPSQDIVAGGLRWAAAVRYFPPGAVHVAVIDPGVGGERDILALRSRGSTFLAPDNGLLGFVASAEELARAVAVDVRRWSLPEVSRTFHGRDIFAPVAARLALGLSAGRLGPRARSPCAAPLPALRRERTPRGVRLVGEVVDVDKYGNCITNIPAGAGRLVDIRAGSARLSIASESYGEVRPGRPLAIIGSSGCLEVAVNRGRADRALGLRRGRRVSAVVEALAPERPPERPPERNER